jgi:hypothetical protein
MQLHVPPLRVCVAAACGNASAVWQASSSSSTARQVSVQLLAAAVAAAARVAHADSVEPHRPRSALCPLLPSIATTLVAAAAAGAIDVEELQYALSVMGIDKSPVEVQELMDSVDKDGSGVLAGHSRLLLMRDHVRCLCRSARTRIAPYSAGLGRCLQDSVQQNDARREPQR